MADLLQSALASLDATQKTHMAQAVTYHRGASSVAVTATPASSEFEVADLTTGLSSTTEMQDFLIAAADIIIGGSVVEPAPGDQVRWVIGSDTFIYEVMEIQGQQCFKYTSPYKNRVRIHSKQIDKT